MKILRFKRMDPPKALSDESNEFQVLFRPRSSLGIENKVCRPRMRQQVAKPQ
jgi:hypothetical protein